MAVQLPRLQGPITEASEVLEVRGIHANSTVSIVDVAGARPTTIHSETFATGGRHRLTVGPGLTAGMLLTATQTVSGETSDLADATMAISVRARPTQIDQVRPPEVRESPARCGRALRVHGVYPGAPVLVRRRSDGQTIGEALPVLGDVRVDLDDPIDAGDVEVFQVFDAFGDGPARFVEAGEEPDPLPPPTVLPMTRCQTTVPLADLIVGATVHIDIQRLPPITRTFVTTASNARARIFEPLLAGVPVSARQEFPDCDLTSEPSDPVEVGAEIPEPYIPWPLCPTDNPTDVRVLGVVAGATLELTVGTDVYADIDVEQDGAQVVRVNTLPDGATVTATQTLCGATGNQSNPAQVRISRYRPTRIATPVYECAASIQVLDRPTTSSVAVVAYFADGTSAIVSTEVHSDWVDITPLPAGTEVGLLVINCGRAREVDRQTVEPTPDIIDPGVVPPEEDDTGVAVTGTLQASVVKVYRRHQGEIRLIGAARGTEHRTIVPVTERLRAGFVLFATHSICNASGELPTAADVTVTVARPEAPRLITPQDGESGVGPLVEEFAWRDPNAGARNAATRFDVEIARTDGQGNPLAFLDSDSPITDVRLEPATRYRWTVTSTNSSGHQASTTAFFTTGISAQPESTFRVVLTNDVNRPGETGAEFVDIRWDEARWSIDGREFPMNDVLTREPTHVLSSTVLIEAYLPVTVVHPLAATQTDEIIRGSLLFGSFTDGKPSEFVATVHWATNRGDDPRTWDLATPSFSIDQQP